MKAQYISLALLSFLFFPLTSSAQKGKLERMEEETQNDNNSSNGFSSDNDGGQNLFGSFVGDLFGQLIYGTTKGLLFGFAGEFEYESDYQFTQYPYQNLDDPESFQPGAGNKPEIYLYYHLADDNITGPGFAAKQKILNFLRLEGLYTLYIESNDNDRDFLHLYAADLNYYRLRFNKFNFWWGIGVLGISGRESIASLSGNLGMELYVVKPLGLYANIRLAQLGGATTNLINLRLTYHLKNVTPFAGFQRLRISGESINSLTLGAGIYFN